MRKFIPLILIVTILASFLAPVGVGINLENKSLVIEKSIVGAITIPQAEAIASKAALEAKMAYLTNHNGEQDVEQKANAEYTAVYNKVYAEQMKDFKGVTKEEQLLKLQKALEDAQKLLAEAKASESEIRIKAAETQVALAQKNLDSFKVTGEVNQSTTDENGVQVGDRGNNSPTTTLPTCGFGVFSDTSSVGGCIVQILYWAVFTPTSFLFALAGTFFDFSFAFSVSDSSYRSPFVVQGWGIVRDFCNLFFIFLMLYIAFTTILNANGAKTKEMIMKVVLVGLFINFSLFFTQIIIDTSNILARVFYTSDAISVTEKNSGIDTEKITSKMRGYEDSGIVPLSVAIVNKIDPQNLISNSKKVTELPNATNNNAVVSGSGNDSPGIGTWIIVIVLASAINIVGFIVFLTVGLVFIGRIVGLWVAMIFAPFAFFSYTVPGLGGVPKFGYKAWFPETLKLAFVAPIFIFFMYLIIAFLEKGLNIMDAREQASNTMYVLSIVFPFIVIMTLMTEAKKIAVKFSGSIGEGLSKVGGAIGGAALALGTGGAALAMRSTIGSYASKTASDQKLKDKAEERGFGGWMARRQLQAANWTAGKSFDVRNTGLGKKIAGAAGKDLDVKLPEKGLLLGVAQGGYKGAVERRGKAKTEEKKLLELSEKDSLEQNDKARVWNNEYMDAMVKAKNDALLKGNKFSESDFKLQYLKLKGPQALTADETNRQRKTDRANEIEYGPDYIVKRNEAREDYRKRGEFFNEVRWRKDNNIEKRGNLTEAESKYVTELRKEGKPEKEPLNTIERDRVTKILDKASENLKHANDELRRIESEFTRIAAQNNLRDSDDKIDISKVDKTHIRSEVEKKQKEIISFQTNITQATAAINKDPYNERAKKDLADAEWGKKKLETEISELNSLIGNREKYQNMKNQEIENINQQNEKLNR